MTPSKEPSQIVTDKTTDIFLAQMNDFKLKVQKWKIRIIWIGGFDGEQVTGDISDLYPHHAKIAEIIPPPNILSMTFDVKYHNRGSTTAIFFMDSVWNGRFGSKWPMLERRQSLGQARMIYHSVKPALWIYDLTCNKCSYFVFAAVLPYYSKIIEWSPFTTLVLQMQVFYFDLFYSIFCHPKSNW